MKIIITPEDPSKSVIEMKAESGAGIEVEAGDRIQVIPDPANSAVVILPNGRDLAVMLTDEEWVALIGANDPEVKERGGGVLFTFS